ncbi:MAG: exodeoxyribonuclease VII small subunit [Nannocystaceae bacterium]
MAIDEVLRNLERVVAELEGGELPLETALERFEAGVRLAREGGKLLDRIEERVEVLLADRDETAPFHDPQAHSPSDETDDDDDF